MNNPLISVIIPVFNVEPYICSTLDGLLNQTYSNWEAILIDDCSTDDSYSIMKKYEKKDPRFKCFKNEKNSGPSFSRNKGLDICKGMYITFLDSDDVWKCDKLEIQIRFMTENKYMFSFTGYDLIDEHGCSLNKRVCVPEKICYNQLLKNTIISTITVMIHNSLKKDVYMPESFSNGEDMAAWLNLLKKVDYAYGINKPLSSYRQVSNSLSHGVKNKLTRMWILYREIEHLSMIKSIYNYIFYIINVLRKRRKTNE